MNRLGNIELYDLYYSKKNRNILVCIYPAINDTRPAISITTIAT